MPEVNPNIKTLEQAIFAGVVRVAAYCTRSPLPTVQAYLATRFPNMPADEMERTILFCRQARKAGIDFTEGKTPDIPVAKGIFLRTTRKVMYHVWQPIVLKDGKRAHGKTDVTSIWIEEP